MCQLQCVVNTRANVALARAELMIPKDTCKQLQMSCPQPGLQDMLSPIEICKHSAACQENTC